MKAELLSAVPARPEDAALLAVAVANAAPRIKHDGTHCFAGLGLGGVAEGAAAQGAAESKPAQNTQK